MLDQHVIFHHRDLGEVRPLTDDHLALDRLSSGQELGLGDDRCAATAGFAALTATLLLGLEAGRARDAGDLVRGVAGFADAYDGVGRVVRRQVVTLAAAAAATAATSRAAATFGVLGVFGVVLPAVLLAAVGRARRSGSVGSVSGYGHVVRGLVE
ncbi:MAG: hypothetical protein WKF83_12330 [Nocardioidaceae bacterium]